MARDEEKTTMRAEARNREIRGQASADGAPLADAYPTRTDLTSAVDLGRFAAAAGAAKGLPPVHKWNPPFCGDIDLRIARDGSWHYNGSPIRRPALVRLFSTVLRKDPDRYVLVTPVERVGIHVEDAPFLAVELLRAKGPNGPILRFRTNVDDWTEAGPDNPMRFEADAHGGLKPYVRVRGDLWALAKRALLYELAAIAETRRIAEEEWFGLSSNGAFFPMARIADLEGLVET